MTTGGAVQKRICRHNARTGVGLLTAVCARLEKNGGL